jgi:hypothetical protein
VIFSPSELAFMDISQKLRLTRDGSKKLVQLLKKQRFKPDEIAPDIFAKFDSSLHDFSGVFKVEKYHFS